MFTNYIAQILKKVQVGKAQEKAQSENTPLAE